MAPVAAPALAERPTCSVNRALAAQDEKLMTTVAAADAPGARLPRDIGKAAGTVTTGEQTGPPIWFRVKLSIDAALAAPGPAFMMLNAHWRALAGPDLPVIAPPRDVPPGVKLAVTVWALFIVIVVEALFALAT